ncbi:hypothetical protein EV363DRAFT_274213 [Boletus edulis]|uniref:Uncharacterized protein n=1 Tax=Boletus edulis BED1 TaxID=1328754 RepID=A0AAD4BDC1_BOLED|nr:hypothetical protein EV363DRAFT_274213 [Boletus edulis]KAF8419982.1 hypothetical protein L210DRAFT_2288781 [Boletus edulis BED1]
MFAIPIGRIYTNVGVFVVTLAGWHPLIWFRKTLLDTLLTRESLKAEMVDTYDVNAGTGPLRWAPISTDSSQAASTVQSSSIQLKVQQTVQETCDRSSTEVDGKVVPLAV